MLANRLSARRLINAGRPELAVLAPDHVRAYPAHALRHFPVANAGRPTEALIYPSTLRLEKCRRPKGDRRKSRRRDKGYRSCCCSRMAVSRRLPGGHDPQLLRGLPYAATENDESFHGGLPGRKGARKTACNCRSASIGRKYDRRREPGVPDRNADSTSRVQIVPPPSTITPR
jgi:hypothetical protein